MSMIEPRLTGARLSALVQEALVYKVLVYQEWHREDYIHAPVSGYDVDTFIISVSHTLNIIQCVIAFSADIKK